MSIVATMPGALGGTACTTAACGRCAVGRSTKSAGPPSALTIFWNVSAARPLIQRLARHRLGRRLRSRRCRRASASRRRARARSLRAAGRAARPVRKATAFITSTALPAAEASGSFMSVMSALVRSPAPFATATRLAASSHRRCDVRHEGAGAGLHVEDQALQPGGELLREDRGGDERHGFDRRRHVADRIEAPVGGRELRRLPDDGAACALRIARPSSSKSGWLR